MKHFLLIFSLVYSVSSFAATRDFGLGIFIGDPLALSARYDQDRRTSYDFQLAWGDHYMMVYGDYLFVAPGFFGHKNEFVSQLTPYVGAGPLLALSSSSHHETSRYFDHHDDGYALAARVPVGAEWRGRQFPLGVGLEIAPGFALLPAMHLFVHFGLSVRFYF